MRTKAELRTDVLNALGFIGAIATPATRTLTQLRESMYLRLGWAAQVASPPTGMDAMFADFLNEAQATLFRRLEMNLGSGTMPTRMSAGTDPCTLDYVPILALACALACKHYNKPEAKDYFEQVERYLMDVAQRMPPNAVTLVTQFLESAHRTLYRRYNVLHTERFFTWTLVSGENMYELDENDEQAPGPSQCLDILDPREVTWAGIERDGLWYPLICGIPPEVYSNNEWSAWPSRYEIRQCIELFPAPGEDAQKLRMKGHAQLGAFAQDADEPNIDDEALYLLATGNAKKYYKQPDAPEYFGMLEAMLSNLTAGRHQTRRYIPGQRPRADYVEPKPLVPFP